MSSPAKKLRLYYLDEVTDKYIGKRGSPKREAFENELRIEVTKKTILKTKREKLLSIVEAGAHSKSSIRKWAENTIL